MEETKHIHTTKVDAESWMSETTALLTVKCIECEGKFRGLVTRIEK